MELGCWVGRQAESLTTTLDVGSIVAIKKSFANVRIFH